jgi:hypothetical protein
MAGAGAYGGAINTDPMTQAANAQKGALAGTASGMMYQPQQVQAGQLATTDISQYQNPYTQQVIDTSMQDLERQRLMQQNQLGAQATQAGAFGGSRHGVAEGMTNEAFARQGGQLAAGLRQQGFQNAQQMAQSDIANRFSADTANQAAGLSGAAQRLGAAQQLGALGAQSFGYGSTIQNNLAMQGQNQQALQQALIDAAKGQYGAYTQYPAAQLSLMSQALGSTPYGQSTTSTKQPGLFDYLTAGASMFSDRRLKKNINVIGKLDSGLNRYSWEWNELADDLGVSDDGYTKGVIAQDVQELFPDAVIEADGGFLMVNYSHPALQGAL